MSFLRKLLGGPRPSSPIEDSGSVLWIYVQCAACGERLRVRVNKANDLSAASDTSDDITDDSEDESAPPSGYVLKKEILGNNCPRLMYVRASFDGRKRLLDMTAENARLLTREEYEGS